MISSVDANLYIDLVNGRSVIGIIVVHVFNKTMENWYSKKQSTVKMAIYGSEIFAAQTAIEQISYLHLQL